MNTTPLLQQLYKRHPKAIYTYFPITNFQTERERFLRGATQNPEFKFDDRYRKPYFQQRLATLQDDLLTARAAEDTAATQFINGRIAQTELLFMFFDLHEPPVNPSLVNAFRKRMVSLYGEPDEQLVREALSMLKIRAQQRKDARTPELLRELFSLTHYNTQTLQQTLLRPTDKQFQEYRQTLQVLLPDFVSFLQTIPEQKEYTATQISEYFTRGFRVLHLNDWRAVSQQQSNRVMVAKQAKQIEIGTQFRPASRTALQQVLAHELVGHVYTQALHKEQTAPLYIEEGFAILLEQLLGEAFSYKRVTRYLAAAFSFGVDGHRRDFKETHEIIWRCFKVLTGCTTARAKERAFGECVRVFRIGNTDIPGAVFLKDKVYLEGNVAIWRLLLAEPPKTSLQQLLQGDWPVQLV